MFSTNKICWQCLWQSLHIIVEAPCWLCTVQWCWIVTVALRLSKHSLPVLNILNAFLGHLERTHLKTSRNSSGRCQTQVQDLKSALLVTLTPRIMELAPKFMYKHRDTYTYIQCITYLYEHTCFAYTQCIHNAYMGSGRVPEERYHLCRDVKLDTQKPS